MPNLVIALRLSPRSIPLPALLLLTSFACASGASDDRPNEKRPKPEEEAMEPPSRLDAAAKPDTRPDAAIEVDAAMEPPSRLDAAAKPDARPDAAIEVDARATEAGASEVGPTGRLIDNPLGAVPMDLKEVGIFPDFPDVAKAHTRAFPFTPKHELWSNGLSKTRLAVIPVGQKIDTSKRDAWEFPVGTLFFKTFGTVDATGKLLPVETRMIRHTTDKVDPADDAPTTITKQWEFFVWEWNAAGTSATLLDLNKRVAREVTIGATKFTHHIPSRKDCWNCHIANRSTIIGFDELRLNWKSPTTTGATLLADVIAKQWLTVSPTAPFATITGRNPAETAALEYLQANCAHCHNGEQQAREPGARYPALDLRYTSAVKSTVNVMTMSTSSKAGIRIVPGMPAKSILLEAVEAIGNPMVDPEVKPMPTVGVDRLDPKASMVLRAWIMTATPAP